MVSNSVESSLNSLVCVSALNVGTANVFMPASITGCSDQLRESMLSIAQTSANLERTKLQQQIVDERKKQNLARTARARVRAAMANKRKKTDPLKNSKKPKVPKKDMATLEERRLTTMMTMMMKKR